MTGPSSFSFPRKRREETKPPAADLVAAVVRPEIRALSAYAVAKAEGMVKLDAMENPYALPAGVRARVSEALAETPWYLRVLRDEAAVVERLATLLGTSRLVPDLIVRAPEVLRLLGDPSALAGRDLRPTTKAFGS